MKRKNGLIYAILLLFLVLGVLMLVAGIRSLFQTVVFLQVSAPASGEVEAFTCILDHGGSGTKASCTTTIAFKAADGVTHRTTTLRSASPWFGVGTHVTVDYLQNPDESTVGLPRYFLDRWLTPLVLLPASALVIAMSGLPLCFLLVQKPKSRRSKASASASQV